MSTLMGSNYVVTRDARLYDSNQELYEQMQRESIKYALGFMQRTPPELIQTLFFNVLASLASRRGKMAQITSRHKDVADFGARRYQHLYTPISAPAYCAYLPNVIQLAISCLQKASQNPLQSCAPHTVHLVRTSHPLLSKETEQAVDTKGTHLRWEAIQDGVRHLARIAKNDRETVAPYYLLLSLGFQGQKSEPILPLSSFFIPFVPKPLETIYPLVFSTPEEEEEYGPTIPPILPLTLTLSASDPYQEIQEILEIQEMLATCDFGTQALRESAIAHLREGNPTPHKILLLIHQPTIHHDTICNRTHSLFIQAMQWQKQEGLSALYNTMADLIYLMQHASLHLRGSASICEHLEMAIYCYHGYLCHYTPERWICLEALTSTHEEFKQHYPELIHLSAVDSSSQ